MKNFPMLLSPLKAGSLTLRNRITMTPLYLGYANPDGSVSEIMVEHYRQMAASGSSLIVVENAGVDPIGLDSPVMLRADRDELISGLKDISKTIHEEGSIAFLQINHAGRYAYTERRMAPSPVPIGDVKPIEMNERDIDRTVDAFAQAAYRVKGAGFDGVEVHGGTGYLLAQFLSPRTNWRTDAYGGSLTKRMQFPLKVVEAVKKAVGDNYPVGYRFLVDEFLPEGLHADETTIYAKELEARGVVYISAMVGVHEAFRSPQYLQLDKKEGGQADYVQRVKTSVSRTPVITSGRIQTHEIAEAILEEGKADLIGLARILFADPLWPKKAAGEIDAPIVPCNPLCTLCTRRAISAKPALCSQWERTRREAFLKTIGEKRIGEE